MASKPSNYEASAPPLPPHQTQPFIYEHYVTPSPPPPPPAYGVPLIYRHEETMGQWSTGLCHCLAHIPTCCLGCICPCFLFGKIAEQVDDGTTSCVAATLIWYVLQQFTSCGCIYSCGFRSKLRARYNLPESPLPDCLVHWLCWPCAFCQEYRELRIRRNAPTTWFDRPVVISPPQQYMTY